MLQAERVMSGNRIDIYFLTGDPRCTAEAGLEAWTRGRTNSADVVEDFLERLRFIADHGEATRSDWFGSMKGRPRIWAVRKARLRLCGFMVDDCLYLCAPMTPARDRAGPISACWIVRRTFGMSGTTSGRACRPTGAHGDG